MNLPIRKKPSTKFLTALMQRIEEIKPDLTKVAITLKTNASRINFPFEFRGVVSNMLIWDREKKEFVKVTFPYWVTDETIETIEIEL